MIHIWRPWKLSHFQDPPPLCPSTSKILPPISSKILLSFHPILPKFFIPLGRPISDKPPTLQMITNQLKENINPNLTICVIRFFLQFGFCLQYQLINFVWLSFDFFSFSWGLTICFFVALYYMALCVLLSTNIMKCLLFIIIHIFSIHFAMNLFICTTWKRKQIMEQQPHRVYDRIKSKQKQNKVMSHSNWPRVLLFDLARKQCNGIIKGWIHRLTSESKGKFLVNNILMFCSAWCLVMTQIRFSLIKKIKIL